MRIDIAIEDHFIYTIRTDIHTKHILFETDEMIKHYNNYVLYIK